VRAVQIWERLPEAYMPDLARSLANPGNQLQGSGDPAGAVEPLLRAWTLAKQHNLEDFAGLAVSVLRQAHARQPEAVAAAFERFTGELWPS
jgi:hypothetical protein